MRKGNENLRQEKRRICQAITRTHSKNNAKKSTFVERDDHSGALDVSYYPRVRTIASATVRAKAWLAGQLRSPYFVHMHHMVFVCLSEALNFWRLMCHS